MKRVLVIVIAFLLLPLIGCRAADPSKAYSATGYYCDTVVTVTAYVHSQSTVDATMKLCADYERVLSKTVEGSDIWNLNHANGEPVEVQPETAALLRLAAEIGEASGGAFDVTVAPVSELWDFRSETHVLPDADALKEAVSRVDYRNIEIDGNTVTLHNGAQLDLGGIAKGYIADRVAEYLRNEGVASACINMGGNVIVIGKKPGGSLWTVGIRDPNGEPSDSAAVLELSDRAAVTSGTYERGFDLDGVRYHHILDPFTGWPVQNSLASVTVIGERSDLCDALSTACFVLGEENSRPLLERYGVRAVFLYADGTRSDVPAQ